jgi:cell division protein FtsQ
MNTYFKNILIYSLGSLILISLISFRALRLSERKVSGIEIEIVNNREFYLIDQFEIQALLNKEHSATVLGANFDQVDFKLLEKQVEENPFVAHIDVFMNVNGILGAKVSQAQPIGRLMNPRGSDQYIDMTGKLLPMNADYTARVPLISFTEYPQWELNLGENDLGKQLMEFLIFINKDEMWKAQIAQLAVNEDNELTLWPQMTKQLILFGPADEIEEKFKKLKLFYKEVLPKKGWNTYSSVNLKYKNQIVCK